MFLLRTRKPLSLNKGYGDSALLVLKGTSLNSVNALLSLTDEMLTGIKKGGGGIIIIGRLNDDNGERT